MKSWPGGSSNSTYKNTPYRLDKLRFALAEAQLKTFLGTSIYFFQFHSENSSDSLRLLRKVSKFKKEKMDFRVPDSCGVVKKRFCFGEISALLQYIGKIIHRLIIFWVQTEIIYQVIISPKILKYSQETLLWFPLILYYYLTDYPTLWQVCTLWWHSLHSYQYHHESLQCYNEPIKLKWKSCIHFEPVHTYR